MIRARPVDPWIWMALAASLTGASQLVSQLVLGRVLGPADYGQIATLYNAMSFVGVPLIAVQLTVTGWVARGGSATPTLQRYAILGVVFGLAALLSAPWWASGLALTSVTACRVAALFLPAAFILAVARGNAIGQRRTRLLAAGMAIAALVRVMTSLVGSRLFGAPGAAMAAVSAELFLGLMLVFAIRSRGEERGPIVVSETAGATYSQLAVWLVINVDLFWARRLLSPNDAGRYLVVGSIALGLVSIGQAFLWHNASSSTDAGAGVGIVSRSAAIVAVASVVLIPIAALGLPALLGPEYTGLTPLLAVAGVWAIFASVMLTGTATQLIAGRRGLSRLLPIAAVAMATPPVAVALMGRRPLALSLAAMLNAALGAAVVMIPQLRRSRHSAVQLVAVDVGPEVARDPRAMSSGSARNVPPRALIHFGTAARSRPLDEFSATAGIGRAAVKAKVDVGTTATSVELSGTPLGRSN